MKPGDHIEARAAVTNAGAVTISQPGSYYLTCNITVCSGNAITFATNGVTLDLKGFTIQSTSTSGVDTAILSDSGLRSLAMVNGFIESEATGYGPGLYASYNANNGAGRGDGVLGLYAAAAQNRLGESASGTGLHSYNASFCA